VLVQQAAAAEGEFTYNQLGTDWGDVCLTGREQAPINIITTDVVEGATDVRLKMDYHDLVAHNVSAICYNQGVTWEVRWKETTGKGGLAVNPPSNDAAWAAVLGETEGDEKVEIEPLQWHVHVPAEEAINGVRHPMNIHLVSADEEGRLVVISAPYKYGEPSPLFERLLAGGEPAPSAQAMGGAPAPMSGEDLIEDIGAKDPFPVGEEVFYPPTFTMDFNELLPNSTDHYMYLGSLTTPPCSEGVVHHVLTTPMEASPEQITALQLILNAGGSNLENTRPLQPLNGRTVTHFYI